MRENKSAYRGDLTRRLLSYHAEHPTVRPKEIAFQCGCRDYTARGILRRKGITFPPVQPSEKMYDARIFDLMERCRHEGMSVSATLRAVKETIKLAHNGPDTGILRAIEYAVNAELRPPTGWARSARRSPVCAHPRFLAWWLASELTGLSLPQIGRWAGNKDHSTIMHGIRRMKEMRQKNQDWLLLSDVLLERLKKGNHENL